jgi:hypothetical protein
VEVHIAYQCSSNSGRSDLHCRHVPALEVTHGTQDPTESQFLEKYNRWHCREKHKAPQFTLKTGTILEDSPIGLDKWLAAVWMIVNCKNGVSSWEIHRTLGVTQKTAWFMNHRTRLSMQDEADGKLRREQAEQKIGEKKKPKQY